ncbi:hypothetical protein Gbem_2132 [Citrifermentans bemidjiense Bem]|uniref:Uncharacterized protein n=1 Tax=Citrifermentans bemidjiense (strain ATCC BAA-1014 / DSM 16622 / JCM 12645 / Bem) TaxID=404380 RepID=B5EDE9_CITBB|nr:hypothetical protein [Citrifermentans bemidjiense]ACH39145.1 hypothetical protein Gbem_2132 [Citrifermentans bemidjiense Bem]
MESNKTCQCGAKHTGHICMLKSAGRSEEIAHISDHPTVTCFTCGAEANSADNVCNPMPMG